MKILILSFFIILSAGWAEGEDLQVCVDPYPPFKIIDSSGRLTGGIDIELTNALTDALGIHVKYSVFPWARCLYNLENGLSDFVSGITKNTEREKILYYIEPPYKTKSVKVFYVNKGDETKFKKFEDLQNSTIGILRKAKYFDQFDNDTQIVRYELSDELAGFKMLKVRRLDAFLTTEEVGDYIIKRYGFSDDFGKAEYKYNKEVAVYFAVSKKSKFAERMVDFVKMAKELREKGTFDRVIGNYLESSN